ncbi:unnamed protein product [[Candida] boidinii]|uniref:Unnamed protein product n=1 Tax=Candida boidinii TaxID=5477 RepID=A0A9W6SWU8_CANBO|nr:unnamed protein product [[Candida] boidinii]
MARNFKPKTKTKKKSQRRALDAFQIAERQEQRKGRGGDDSDDGSDDEFSVKNGTLDARRHLGEKYDPDEEFEDEELDSDEALGSDDEYDILNSKFSQTLRDKRKNKKNASRKNSKKNSYESESDSEEEEGYSSIDESELIPLSEVWARDDEDLKKTLSQKTSTTSQTKPKSNDIILDDSISSESEEESNSESSDDEDDQDSEESDFSDNEEDEDGMKELDEDPFDELDSDEDDEDEESALKNVISKLTSKQKQRQQREKKAWMKMSTKTPF